MKPMPTRARELTIMAITMIMCCAVWFAVGGSRVFAGGFVFSGAVILGGAMLLWWRDSKRS
jgi:hypothetical protein